MLAHSSDLGCPPARGSPTCDFGHPGRDLQKPSIIAISASDFGIRFRNGPRNWQLSCGMYGFALMRADPIDRYWPRKSWPENGASRLAYPAIHSTFHALTRRLDAIANEGGLSAVESLVLSVAAARPMEGIFAMRHATGLRPSTLNSILNRLENRDLLRRAAETPDRQYVDLHLTVDGQVHAVMAREATEELERELAVFASPVDRAAAGALLEPATALARRGAASDY
jgi:DNA-binding MarR family transcriptional regulator